MNGISLAISKSCCPVYNFGISNKINHGTNNNIDLISCRLANLHRQRISPFEATKPMLKHRVYSSSASKHVTGSRFEEPEVGSAVLSYVWLGVGITWYTLLNTCVAAVHFVFTKGWKEGVLKSNACYYIILGVGASCVAGSILDNLMSGFAVLSTKFFSIGDIIEFEPLPFEPLRGRVIEMGLITTSILFTPENRLTELPTSWLIKGQDVVNKSGVPLRPVFANFHVKTDKFEKIPEISEEIRNLMRSKPFIYLDKELQPLCYLTGLDPFGVTLSLACHLKKVVGEEEKLSLVENDICEQSIKIIEKHGATLGEHFEQ